MMFAGRVPKAAQVWALETKDLVTRVLPFTGSFQASFARAATSHTMETLMASPAKGRNVRTGTSS